MVSWKWVKTNWLIILLLVFALVGFADASFLTAKTWLGSPVPCTLVIGCDTVLTSKYATIGSLPISALGMGYYFLVFSLGWWYWRGREKTTLFLLGGLTTTGVIVSAYLVYLQGWVLRAICPYCLVSALVSLILFGLAVVLLVQRRAYNKGDGLPN